MKTIMIWDTQIDPIRFAVFDGDLSRLDRVYLNSVDDDESKQDELNALMYNEDGSYKVTLLDEFPAKDVCDPDGSVTIVAGFLP